MRFRTWIGAFGLGAIGLAGGCGGAQTPDEPVAAKVEISLASCQAAADETKAALAAFEAASANTIEDSLAAYAKFRAARAPWDAEDHICRANGPDVSERTFLHGDMRKALIAGEEKHVSRLATAFAESDVEGAFRLLRARFETGEPASSDLQRAALDVTQQQASDMLEKFNKTERYGKLDDRNTTCVFSGSEFRTDTDPEPIFGMVFEGRTDVYALCRLPLPADKYARDPDGEIVLVLDDDDDDDNGNAAEMSLGEVEKWKNLQAFKGRFTVPYGATDAKTGYYRLTLVVKRPEMGDEKGSTGSFLWFRE